MLCRGKRSVVLLGNVGVTVAATRRSVPAAGEAATETCHYLPVPGLGQ